MYFISIRSADIQEGKGTYILALPASTARRAVQEVLSKAVARVIESRAGAAEHAVAIIASIRIVGSSCIPAHNALTLLIARRALATSTLEPVAAIRTIRIRLIFRAIRSGSRAAFLRIARADAGTAHGLWRSELAVLAAVLVGVVADGAFFEFAGSGVATLVVAAALGPAAIALLVTFYDAVAAGLALDGDDVAVVGEAAGFDAVATESGANVSD